jgi:hypothetical protein
LPDLDGDDQQGAGRIGGKVGKIERAAEDDACDRVAFQPQRTGDTEQLAQLDRERDRQR